MHFSCGELKWAGVVVIVAVESSLGTGRIKGVEVVVGGQTVV